MSRVDNLCDRDENTIKNIDFIPYKSLIPLQEIIADVLSVGKQSKKVQAEYFNLVEQGGNEFNVLLNLSENQLNEITSKHISEAIVRVRQGKVKLTPGFDGQYGKIEIFSFKEKNKNSQIKLL